MCIGLINKATIRSSLANSSFRALSCLLYILCVRIFFYIHTNSNVISKGSTLKQKQERGQRFFSGFFPMRKYLFPWRAIRYVGPEAIYQKVEETLRYVGPGTHLRFVRKKYNVYNSRNMTVE